MASTGADAAPAPSGSTVRPCAAAAAAGSFSGGADHLIASTTSAMLADASSMRDWMIALHEVAFQRKIGAGSAGTTYMAEWRGAHVAVKVAGYTGASMEGWRAEVDALTRLRHPNIVQYLGCVVSPPTYCLVLEFCDAGDLYRALRLPSPPGLFLRVARAVGAGMAYLHRRQIMHATSSRRTCCSRRRAASS